VTTEKANRYKEENNINLFKETSAVNGDSCKDIFVEAARMLYDDYVLYNNSRKESTVTGFNRSDKQIEASHKVTKHDTSVRLDKSIHIESSKPSRCKC
jgi:hypothetical protein